MNHGLPELSSATQASMVGLLDIFVRCHPEPGEGSVVECRAHRGPPEDSSPRKLRRLGMTIKVTHYRKLRWSVGFETVDRSDGGHAT